MITYQQRIHEDDDVFETKTADDESSEEGREENEIAEDKVLGGIVGVSLAEIDTERAQVKALLELARAVYGYRLPILPKRESKHSRCNIRNFA